MDNNFYMPNSNYFNRFNAYYNFAPQYLYYNQLLVQPYRRELNSFSVPTNSGNIGPVLMMNPIKKNFDKNFKKEVTKTEAKEKKVDQEPEEDDEDLDKILENLKQSTMSIEEYICTLPGSK